MAVGFPFVIGVVVVVEGVGGQTACFDGGAEGFSAHLAAGGRGLLVDHAVLGVVGRAELVVGMAGLASQCDALGCGTGGCVCDCEHGDDCADDNGCGAGASGADKRVAVVVIRLHADGGHGEVCAVDGYHSSLGEPGLRVVFLNGRVD